MEPEVERKQVDQREVLAEVERIDSPEHRDHHGLNE
jgi:hypothetical protein